MGTYTDTLSARLQEAKRIGEEERLGLAAVQAEHRTICQEIGPWSNRQSIHIVGEAKLDKDPNSNRHLITLQVLDESEADCEELTGTFARDFPSEFVFVKFVPVQQ